MDTSTRTTRSLFAAAIAATFAAPAPAQDVKPAVAALEEVIVTSRRREENIQSIPVAVSAFDSRALADLQADRLDALMGAVPNLNLVQGRGSAASANVYIRGIGQPDALQTFDPAAGIYVDDVFLSRIQGALLSLSDIERVEVLRGPQGTLYGKNTIAGAIKVISKKPGKDPVFDADLTLGSEDLKEARLYVAGPLSDTLSASFAGAVRQRDGFVTDYSTNKEYNDEGSHAARMILRWEPSDRGYVQASFDYTKQDTGLTLGRAEAPVIQTSLAPAGTKVLAAAPTTEYDFSGRTSFKNGQGQVLEHSGLNVTGEVKLSDAWTLRSITGYRKLKPELYVDIDATQYQLGDVKVFIDQDQLSEELQFLYDAGGKVRLVTGVYYLEENITSEQAAYGDDIYTFLGNKVTFTRTIGDDLSTQSLAAFAHLTWAFSDALTGTLGLRYTKEDKDYSRTTSTFFGAPFAGLNSTFAFTASDSWDATTPSASLDYKLSDDVMLYASAGRGFKSGGFNGRANAPGENKPYDPEYVTTYEVGAKTRSMDDRLVANFALFYSDYEDFQARVGGATIGEFPVLNAGKMEIYGAEAEFLARPVPALTLRANLGYLHADYKEFYDPRFPNNDHSQQEPPFAPELTAGLGAYYEFELGAAGNVTLGADANYRDKAWLSVDNRDVLTQEAYWLVNAYATWRSSDGRLRATLGGKNLTDEVYKTDAQEFSNVANIQTAYYGAPRTWSVTLGVSF